MFKLIINADDFGLCEAVNKGVIRGMVDGVVSDTTLMVGMPYAKKAVTLAKQHGIEKMGLHLNLTCGKPVLRPEEVPSLVDENGNFLRRVPLMLKQAKMEDVKKELFAQYALFTETGLRLTHFDSHHHMHLSTLEILECVMDLAHEKSISLRNSGEQEGIGTKTFFDQQKISTTDFFTTKFWAENSSVESLKSIIEDTSKIKKDAVLEIMCHPSYVDQELLEISSYNVWRANELLTLTGKEIKRFIRNYDFMLGSFDLIS